MVNYFEEIQKGISGAVSNASDYFNKSVKEKGIFGTIDSLAGEFSTTIKSGKQLLNARALQEQVDKENEENIKRQTQLLELAKREKDVNRKKVYLDIASKIKSVNQEDLDRVVSEMNTDVVSNVAGTTLDVATLTPFGGIVKGFTAAGKAAKIAKAQEVARKSLEAKKIYDNLSVTGKFLSKTGTLGKEMAKGAGIGTAFGVTAGLTERPEDRNLMESATFGATLGAGMPVVGTILGGAFAGVRGGVNKSKPIYEKVKKNLDEFSKSDKLKGDFASDYLKVRMEQKPTIFQKAAGKTVKTLESIEKLPQRFLDANNIFLKAEEQLLKEKRKTNPNATISDEERIYLNRKLSSSKVAELNRKDDEEVLALIEKNNDIKDDIQRIQIAQRDLERVENGLPTRSYLNPEKPLTKEEAIENLAKARSVVQEDKLERVDTALQEWSDYFRKDLQKEVELGHKTQKEVDTIMSKNINYVPFNTVQEDIEDIANRYAIGGTEIPKDYIKKQSGSLGRITDPWQTQRAKIQMRNDFLIKNKNNRELVDTSTKYNLGIASPLQTAKEITRKEELINRFDTSKKSIKTLTSQLNKETKKAKKDEEKIKLLQSQINEVNNQRKTSWQEIQTLGKKEVPEGYTEIPVWRDGVKESWAIKNDVADVIKNTDRSEVLQTVGDIFQPVNNIFKKLTTTLNPAFQLANKLRDTQTVWITAKSLIEERAEKYGLANLKLSDKEMNEIYSRMKSNYSVNKEYESGNKLLNSVGLKKEIDPNKNIFEQATNFLEDSTRKEVFKEALKSGLDIDSAASVARDATIDFEKMGTYMQDLNRIFPFLNARVQGLANTTTSLVKNPEAFMRNQIMTAMYPTTILERRNNNFESYKDIDQQTKDRFWVYMIGENDVMDENGINKKVPLYITIPKGEAQQMVANPMQYFLAKARSQDPRSVDKMILDTVGSASPVTIDTGMSSGKNPLLSLASMNPITSFAAGVISNKQPYFQTDIVPSNLRDANQAAYTKFKETTPEALKDLSKQIYDKSGGKLDWSPAYIEFAIKSFGGLPSDVLKQMNIMYNASQGKGTEALGEKGQKKPLEGAQKFLQEASKHMIANKFLREMDTDYSPTKQEEEREFKELERKELTSKAETKSEVKDYIDTATQKLIEGDEDRAYDYLLEVVSNARNTMTKEEADIFVEKIEKEYNDVYDKMVVGSNTGLVKTGNSLKDAWSAAQKLNEMETKEEKNEYLDLLYEVEYMTPAVESAFESLVRAGKINGASIDE